MKGNIRRNLGVLHSLTRKVAVRTPVRCDGGVSNDKEYSLRTMYIHPELTTAARSYTGSLFLCNAGKRLVRI